MKALLFSILTIFSSSVWAQERIYSYIPEGDFGTYEFHIYSDSTFSYMRGNCTQTSTSFGKVFTRNDSTFLLAFAPDKIEWIKEVELIKRDTCSLEFDVELICPDGKVAYTDFVLTGVDTARAWITTNDPYFLRYKGIMTIDTTTWRKGKPKCTVAGLCLTEFSAAAGNKFMHVITETVCNVRIYTALPYEALRIPHDVHITPINNEKLNIDGKLYYIVRKE